MIENRTRGLGDDAAASWTLRGIVTRLNAAFVAGFKVGIGPNSLPFVIGFAPWLLTSAKDTGVGFAASEYKKMGDAGAPADKLTGAWKIVAEHANAYPGVLAAMLSGALASRPRSQLGSMMEIKKAAATFPTNSLIAERWIALQQIVDILADRHNFPFNDVAALNRLKLHGDGALDRHSPFEDDTLLVGPDSPFAEWYFRNDSNQWNRSDKIYGGDSGCHISFMERVVELRVWGYDPCNLGDSLLDQVGGMSKGGGNWIMMIIQAGAAGTTEGIARLKLEMIMRRNLWCYENGVTPPSFSQIGSAIAITPISFSVPDIALDDPLAEPATPPAATTSPIAAIAAGAVSGFFVGGQIGAVVGGLLAAAAKLKGDGS